MSKKYLLMLPVLALMLLSGCGRDSDADRREAINALYAEARTAEGRNETSNAIELYKTLLQKDPELAEAHFSLAVLLQNGPKDYIGAIYHYQTYLKLDPSGDKAPVAKSCIDTSRSLLTARLATDAINSDRQQLQGELSDLKTNLATEQKKVAALERQLAEKDGSIVEQERQIAELRKIIASLQSVEVAPVAEAKKNDDKAVIAEAKQAIEDADKKPGNDSETEALLAAVRADADRMLSEVDGGASRETSPAEVARKKQERQNAATRAVAEGAKDETPLSAIPVKGRKYLVRPGDTMSKLAREAYGNATLWRTIRDANRSTSNPDGRLRAGETILIP